MCVDEYVSFPCSVLNFVNYKLLILDRSLYHFKKNFVKFIALVRQFEIYFNV